MSNSNFIFRDANNLHEETKEAILKKHIEIIRNNASLPKPELATLIASTKVDLERELMGEISEFSDLCINSSEEGQIKIARTLDPIYLKHFVMGLQSSRHIQILDIYDYEANVVYIR